MKARILYLLSLSLLFFICGCVEEVTHSDLVKIEKPGNTFPTYLWYMGSEDGYDYFHASFNKQEGMGCFGIYKVVSHDTQLNKRFKLTDNREIWCQYPNDPTISNSRDIVPQELLNNENAN